MRNCVLLFVTLILIAAQTDLQAENMTDAAKNNLIVYKTVGDTTVALALDLPKGEGPFPVCIWVHGGGWRQGDLSAHAKQSEHMATLGVAGVRINYRMIPDGVKCEDTFADVLDSANWVIAHATEYKFDTSRIAFAGASAGGHLSALAAQKVPQCIAHIGYNGVYDLTAKTARRLHSIPGVLDYLAPLTPEHLKSISPRWVIRKNPPETLLLHGTNDTTVPHEQSLEYAEALRAAGGKVEVILFEGENHGFHNPGRGKYQESLDATQKFLLRVFGMSQAK